MAYRSLNESNTIKDLQRPVFNERALRNWYSAAAYADRQPVSVMSLSDSILEGHNMTASVGTPSVEDLPMHRLHRALQTKYAPNAGQKGQYYPFTLSFGATTQPLDWPATLTGGTQVSGNSFGIGSRSYTFTGSNSITIELTTAAPDAELRLYYVQYSGGGTFRWTLDGGATNTVSTVGPLKDMTYAALPIATAGTHSMVITLESGTLFGTGYMVLEDSEKTAGIRMFEGGHAGVASSYFASSNYLGDWVAAAAPELVILELGTNDYSNANPQSAADMTASMETIIDTIRGARPESSLLLCSPWKLTTTTPPIDPWKDFRQALKDVALAKSCAFLDLSPSVRNDEDPTDTNAGGMLSDYVHLSVAGARRISSVIASVL